MFALWKDMCFLNKHDAAYTHHISIFHVESIFADLHVLHTYSHIHIVYIYIHIVTCPYHIHEHRSGQFLATANLAPYGGGLES